MMGIGHTPVDFLLVCCNEGEVEEAESREGEATLV